MRVLTVPRAFLPVPCDVCGQEHAPIRECQKQTFHQCALGDLPCPTQDTPEEK